MAWECQAKKGQSVSNRKISERDIEIVKGDTLDFPVYWEDTQYVYKPISAIPNTAPATVEANNHGLVNGWRAAIVSVGGMRQINAEDPARLRDSDFHEAVVISANSVQFNDINPSEFSAYTSGGYLQYWGMVDLTGYSARLTVRDKVGGTELLSLTSALDGGIVIDNATKTITLGIDAADTAAITWKRGVYDLEMISAAGKVTKIMKGAVSVVSEITT
jgi:hypothetical protein